MKIYIETWNSTSRITVFCLFAGCLRHSRAHAEYKHFDVRQVENIINWLNSY